MQGVSAAYSLDADCADVVIEGGNLLVSGPRACTTQIMAVLVDSVVELTIEVKARPQQLEFWREAQRRTRQIQESGSFSTSYASDRSETETTLDLVRAQGPSSTSMSLTFLNGDGYTGAERRSAIPHASVEIDTPDFRLGLLDRRIDDSPLTLDNVNIRGVHLDLGSWYGHVGIASLSGFREKLTESDPDSVAAIGYRMQLSPHSLITTTMEGIHASNRFLSGRSGVIGSVKYEYFIPQRLHLTGQIGVSRGVGSSATFDYTNTATIFALRARIMPVHFAALSNARGPGLVGSAALTQRLSTKLSLVLDASRETYTAATRPTETMQMLSARFQWRATRHISTAIGNTVTTFSGTSLPGYRSFSVPASISAEWRRGSNSFQYDFKQSELNGGSNSFRDSLGLHFRSVTLTAMAGRQTQAPTLDYVLDQVPGLRQTLLASGASVSSPEQLLAFLRDNADLIAGGALRDLTFNITPVRRELGATAQWTPTRKITGRLEWRDNHDQGVANTTSFTTLDARVRVKLTSDTELSSGVTFINSSSAGRAPLRGNAFTVGIRRQFYTVPEKLLPTFGGGTIAGGVYLDTHDSANQGDSKFQGAIVVLDRTRRVRTNSAGRYSFGSVPPGKHSVDVMLANSGPYVSTTSPHVIVNENAIVDFRFGLLSASVFGSVRNDAGSSLGGIVLHVSGMANTQARSQGSGMFLLNELQAGSYTVSIDADSLPPGYDIASLAPVTVSTEPGSPGRADLRVRALRTMSGRIVCSGKAVGDATVTLTFPDQSVRSVALDELGNFFARDLPAGTQRFDVIRGEQKLSTSIDLGSDPVSRSTGNIDICAKLAVKSNLDSR